MPSEYYFLNNRIIIVTFTKLYTISRYRLYLYLYIVTHLLISGANTLALLGFKLRDI